jgi:iron complex outermembrane receptor protein
MKLKLSAVATALAMSGMAQAAETASLDEVVVTAPQSTEPLTVKTNPKKPRQPAPAHDGADYLKTIPGFSVIRKGGTDGDPVFRGMAGSRINVLLNGENILGGCGGRMDPPTAYVFPAAYDSITVLKGPQSVVHGAGTSAATVMFDQTINRAQQAGLHGDAALTVGSFGRHDEVVSGRVGGESAYARVDGTRTQADDYKDGAGNSVRSKYMRWSGNAALGWTPDDDTVIQASAAKSDGYAAYADRSMDGVKFARENFGLKFDKKHVSSLVDRIEAQAFYNYIDHVMDNFTLRPAGMGFMVNNPDRKTIGGRIATTLLLGEATKATIGLDNQSNVHTFRSGSSTGMGASAAAANAAYLNAPRVEDMRFKQTGVFVEATHAADELTRMIAGLRVDFHEAHDSRTAAASSTSGQTDKASLKSYFGRYEMDREGDAGTTYIGLGHAERSPDYWERKATTVAGSTVAVDSSFFIKPEKTTQLDVGTSWRSGAMTTSVSAFYGKVTDYILMKWANNLTPLPVAQARNVNVTTMGGEADMSYRIDEAWQSNVTLAYVHATNDTDSKPLAQQPPLELRLGANYDDKTFLFGALLRVVAAQERYDVGSGNIVYNGMDLGRTGGFSVFSLNGGWHASKSVLVTAGVDNVFNKQYSEALSRGFGAAVSGYTMPTNTRISEMGRNAWVKANFDF